jgi:septal ring factor EnvC (AmiA/AmiB activator)
MNTKVGVAILAAACVGLAVVLIVVKQSADTQRQQAVNAISEFSNQLDKATTSLNDLRQVNLTLNSDLATNRAATLELSNNLALTSNTLAGAETSLQTAQQQITNLNDRVTQLQARNQELDQQVGSLSNTIASLDTQITLTQMQLATTRTNNTFLESELKKQVAQREELERKFNDLKTVRTQVHKLKTDALVARRLEWIREGIDPTKPMKGGQLLMTRGSLPVPGQAAPAPNYNLNVEVRSDGSVRVMPATNAPAATTNSP